MHQAQRTLLAVALGLAACDTRIVVPTAGESPPPIQPPPSTTAPVTPGSTAVGPTPAPVDGSVSCAPPLRWRFVSDAPAPEEAAGATTFAVTGRVSYHGPIREPLTEAPDLRHEVQIVDDSGRAALRLQYVLPAGIELPIREHGVYAFTIARRWQWEGWAEALLIAKLERSIWPVIFVGEPALMGQALDLRDPLLGPLRLELRPGPACTRGDAVCGEGATRAALRFEFSTGAGVAEALLAPGEQGTLPIFGLDYSVTNLASHALARPCADEASFRASYTIVAPPSAQ